MSLSYKRALRVASLQQVLYRFEEQRLVKIQQKLSQLETEIESAVRALNDTNHDTLARAFANRLAGLSREFETAKSDYRNQMRAVATQHGKVKAAQKKLRPPPWPMSFSAARWSLRKPLSIWFIPN